ncbi:hypothetical protein INR49_007358, partial [Caranx melampygus]
MERADRGRDRDSRLLKNQPYDESLEVIDPEEVASVYSPAPYARQSQSRRSRPGPGLMSANSSSDEFDEDHKAQKVKEPNGVQPGASPNDEDDEEEEEEEEEDDDDSDEDDTDDDEEPGQAPEGAYDPADYANLPVSTEVKELFQYITRYTPQSIELEHSLKPFIPDFIPAVGDIDAFLKVPRPDNKADGLGLLVLDEPSKVSSVVSPQSNPRAVDSWVDSISALHRSKPPASVQYGRPMPDIDSLMQEWPAELEELLGRLRLPSARLGCGLGRYADLLCCLLDVPVYGSRVQSLHLLFSLYL